ncbi:hypothetical protein CFC21_074073, partial [Triticum aestivum]
PSPSPSSAAA